MEIEKIERGKWQILGLPIRGYDWTLIRKRGIGTYAVIAGSETDSDADDEELIVEEFSEPDRREFYDKATIEDLAEFVHRDVLATLAEKETE